MFDFEKSTNFQTDFKLLLPPFFVLDVLRNPPVSGYEKCLLMVAKRPPGRFHLLRIHDFVYLYICICDRQAIPISLASMTLCICICVFVYLYLRPTGHPHLPRIYGFRMSTLPWLMPGIWGEVFKSSILWVCDSWEARSCFLSYETSFWDFKLIKPARSFSLTRETSECQHFDDWRRRWDRLRPNFEMDHIWHS